MSLEKKIELLTDAITDLTATIKAGNGVSVKPAESAKQKPVEKPAEKKVEDLATEEPAAEDELVADAATVKNAFLQLVNTKGKGRASMELILNQFKAKVLSDLAEEDYEDVLAAIQKELG